MKVGLTPDEVEKTLDLAIVCSIPQSNDVPTSINHGKPIVLDNPRHPVSQAIKRARRSTASPTHRRSQRPTRRRARRLRPTPSAAACFA